MTDPHPAGHSRMTGRTKFIISRAHEWRGGGAPQPDKLTCIRCGQKTTIGHWDIPRCIPHHELPGSGFRDEPQ